MNLKIKLMTGRARAWELVTKSRSLSRGRLLARVKLQRGSYETRKLGADLERILKNSA